MRLLQAVEAIIKDKADGHGREWRLCHRENDKRLMEILARLIFSNEWSVEITIDDPDFAQSVRDLIRDLGGDPDKQIKDDKEPVQ